MGNAYSTPKVELTCPICDKKFLVKPSHADKRVHCSYKCMGLARKGKFSGENNPRYKNTPSKYCAYCGKQLIGQYRNQAKYCDRECMKKGFQNRVDLICPGCSKLFQSHRSIAYRRKYCSFACRDKSPENLARLKKMSAKSAKIHDRKVIKICEYCGIEYKIKRSHARTRRHCSRACMIETFRLRFIKMNTVKRDLNQDEIVEALRDIGATVVSITMVGGGAPDLIVGFRGLNYLMEIKNPAHRTSKLSDKQITWHESWKGDVSVVWSIEEALETVGAILPVSKGK